MKTDTIRVMSSGEGAGQALDETGKMAAYIGLSGKEELRLRLLSEEVLGIVSAIAGDFEADFWMEGQKDKSCRIHLEAETIMDYSRKKEFIDISSTKKNAAYSGFMGKIREMVENSIYAVNEVGSLQAEYGSGPVMYGCMGMYDPAAMATDSMIYMWSMERYKESVEEAKKDDQAAAEAWDELEKSIVANIADNVSVAVKGDTVELIVEKQF